MHISDSLIILSTLIGPVLAVQAQKVIEAVRERQKRKSDLFALLMATRANRVSSDHVRALNMVDLVFYGTTTFGIRRRSKKEQVVLDAWKEYLDHLNTKVPDAELALWSTKSMELFLNLLYAISRDTGFVFDRVQLKNGYYHPVAQGDMELENRYMRSLLMDLMEGKRPIPIRIDSFKLPNAEEPRTEAPQKSPPEDVAKL